MRGGEFFEVAYRDLTTERLVEAGPIPWSAAMAYADRKGLRPDIAAALWVVVTHMDSAERGWRLEQLQAEVGGG